MEVSTRLRYAAFVGFCFFISACGVDNKNVDSGDHSNSVSVIKSQSDERSYAYRELANGLKVLLISDPDSTKAAASLNVTVGSKDNPVDRLGLAHFLEHMLFLGTDKYPQPEEYQQFIADNGGQHNAYTAFENTNYFFDIDAGKLEPALDRFARFFVAPLLNEEYVAREKNAVDSEYKAYIRNEYRRNIDVVSQIANPANPFARFTVGNLDTLAGSDLRVDTLAFYREHYSANRMTLVVMGTESLDQLASWVDAKFSEVPNYNYAQTAIAEPLFLEGTLPLRLDIRPDKEVRQLALAFPLPDVSAYRYDKPLNYIGDIVGHEGEGSLYQHLRALGWAEGLSTGQQVEYRGGALFGINISLTRQGLDHVDEIIAYVFQTLDLIRNQGINAARFEELQKISAVHFDYQQTGEESSYVSQLAVQMADYEPREILHGPYAMQKYDPEVIGSLLAHLAPENVLVSVTAPELAVDKVTDLYAVQYRATPITFETRQQWLGVAGDAIALPAPNLFLPEDTTVLPLASANVPTALETSPEVSLWYGQSTQFRQPRGNISVLLESPLAGQSAKNAVLNTLYVELAAERLNVKAYPATLLGLNSGLQSSLRGIQVNTSGLNDKQPELLALTLAELRTLDFSPDRLEVLRQQLIRRWHNERHEPPFQVLLDEYQELMRIPAYSTSTLALAAESVTVQDLKLYIEQFQADVTATVQVYGNFSASDAQAIAALVGKHANSPKVPVMNKTAVVQLPTTTGLWWDVTLEHKDTAVVNYFQGRSDSNTDRVQMGLTAQILKPGYFHQLRTEQQFGYIVFAGPAVLERMPGLMLVVQSPERSVDEIVVATQQFLQQSGKDFAAMTAEEFDKHRQTLIDLLEEPAKNIDEQGALFWDQLLQHYYKFDRTEQLVTALKNLSLVEWQQFYADRFLQAPSRQLLITSAAGRSTAQVAEQFGRIESVTGFKADVQTKEYP